MTEKSEKQTSDETAIIPSLSEQDLAGLFDFSAWPVVVGHMPGYATFRMERWLAGFDLILSRRQPFVFIIDLAGFLQDPRESHEEKKKGTRWMKAHRETMSAYCKGNVYIVADPAARAQVLEETRKQGEWLGFPFEAAADLAEARQVAQRLLADAAA